MKGGYSFLIRIYGEQYEVDKFIEETLPAYCWKQSCEKYDSCTQCLADYYGLQIEYDEIKANKS